MGGESQDNMNPTGDGPFTKVLYTFGGDGVVVVLPGELSLDESSGCQALQSLDDLEIGDIKLVVLWCVIIFLGDQHALYRSNQRGDGVRGAKE